jgi:hypothetical protein
MINPTREERLNPQYLVTQTDLHINLTPEQFNQYMQAFEPKPEANSIYKYEQGGDR